MKNYSIFDIVGPNMIGPSSSHTAGAARIGIAARKIAQNDVDSVVFYLHGSFAQTYKGHGTDRALVGGILGFGPEDERIRKSFDIAKENGINFEFIKKNLGQDFHPNTVKIEIKKSTGEILSVTGSSIGGGNMKIVDINGFNVEFTGEYHTLMVKQWDKPGAAAHITNCLAKHEINIAFMNIYREEKGNNAFTIIKADDTINEKVVEDIKSNQNLIQEAIIVSL